MPKITAMEALSKQLANMGVDVSRTVTSRTRVSLRNKDLNNMNSDLENIKHEFINNYESLYHSFIRNNTTYYYHINDDHHIFEIDWVHPKWKKDTKIRFNMSKQINGNDATHKVNISKMKFEQNLPQDYKLIIQDKDDATFEYTRRDNGEATVFTYKKNKPKALLIAIALYQLFYNEFDTRMHKPPINIILKSGKSVDKIFTTFKDFLFYVAELSYKNAHVDATECDEKKCTVMGGKKKAPKVKK